MNLTQDEDLINESRDSYFELIPYLALKMEKTWNQIFSELSANFRHYFIRLMALVILLTIIYYSIQKNKSIIKKRKK
jgi:hypothetical protein